MKINLDFEIKNLDGQPVASAGKVLASELAAMNDGNAVKLWDWAIKLHNNVELEIDQADFDSLLKIVENSKNLTVLAKGQILNWLKTSVK